MIICIEGINGVGKTTAAKAAVKHFAAQGRNIRYARLPGCEDIPECVTIRDILQHGESLTHETKYHLYMADMGLFYQWVDPEAIWVVDRSFISTVVYQTVDGIPGVEQQCYKEGFYVNHGILLTCDPTVAVQRLNARESKTLANYKDRDVGFYDMLQNGYQRYITLAPTHDTLDTTNQSIDETVSSVIEAIAVYLDK